MKFLVVDDSTTMQRIVTNTLNNIGYKDVHVANNGLEAIKMIKDSRYDAIMTDWNMPKMDGLSLVQKLRKMEMYKETPIIMITTEGGKREVLTALRNGVNNYIIKPFNTRTLASKLQDII